MSQTPVFRSEWLAKARQLGIRLADTATLVAEAKINPVVRQELVEIMRAEAASAWADSFVPLAWQQAITDAAVAAFDARIADLAARPQATGRS